MGCKDTRMMKMFRRKTSTNSWSRKFTIVKMENGKKLNVFEAKKLGYFMQTVYLHSSSLEEAIFQLKFMLIM